MLKAPWKFAPALLLVFAANSAEPDAQNIRLDQKLQIPGVTLKPGEYTFRVEDRLRDRAILRIEERGSDKHYLLLAAPNDKLGHAGQNGLIYFRTEPDKKQILRAWTCPGCSNPLELVYSKPEAAKILAASGDSVLASDPQYDKLPAHLSADDMKVVTLWLLAPQRITADHHGAGVSAAKYTAPALTDALKEAQRAPGVNQPGVPPAPPMQTGRAVAEQTAEAAPLLTAHANPQPMRMPHTATNTFELALCGLLLTAAASASTVAGRRNGRRKNL